MQSEIHLIGPAAVDQRPDGLLDQVSKGMLSPMQMVLQELEETSGGALFATLEEMSMVLGSRMRDDKNLLKEQTIERKRQALITLLAQMQQREGAVQRYLNAQSGTHENANVQRILSVALLLATSGLSRSERKKLTTILDELLQQDGWEVELFGMIELGSVNSAELAPLKRLFQQAMDEETASLMTWFRRIADWPDRRRRLRVLIRMMAFELTLCPCGEQQQRLAAVLTRLRRLLLFLGLEKECQREETLCELPTDSLLPLLLDITTERWVFDDWLVERLAPLVSSRKMQRRLLHHLDALFTVMPDSCFSDEDQREQIVTVLRELKLS